MSPSDGIEPGVVLPPGHSMFEAWAGAPKDGREARVDAMPAALLEGWDRSWPSLARAAQRAPEGSWRTWLMLAGRGFGKTRAGAEWVRERAESDGRARIALVAATLAEARAVMVEGETGLLAISPPGLRPEFQPANRRLVWKNGAQAQLYSAGEPESLRGPQHHFAWCDEIGKWARGTDVWDMLAMGLRLGSDPRTVATSTPRAVPLVRMLAAEASADGPVRLTRGRTTDNRAYLAPAFLETMAENYGGTLLGRQELDGELIEEIEGALWSRALIERARVEAPPEALRRVVIGVDPPAGANASSDACGIVAVGLAGAGREARGYVLADASVQGASPEGWARAVARAAAAWNADRVIAESNNGGAMIESVLRAADAGLPVKLVHAAQGKVARAEPVAALYEGGRAFHAGTFPELEDEMAGLMLGGGYAGPGRSPDRADALVWAMTALLLERRAAEPGVRRL